MKSLKINSLSKELRLLIAAFVITLNFGFFSGLLFIENTTSFKIKGIEEQYIGNEADEDAEVMKFKKSDKEMLTLIHNHVLSFSVIFFLLGGLLTLTGISTKWKKILIIEPFVSVFVSFGGLFLLWKGIVWMKYIVFISGVVMGFTILISSVLILSATFSEKTEEKP